MNVLKEGPNELVIKKINSSDPELIKQKYGNLNWTNWFMLHSATVKIIGEEK